MTDNSSAVAEKRRHAECALVVIFGLEVYSRMQKISYASVNAWCNFITDRCCQIGVHAVADMTPKTVKTIE